MKKIIFSIGITTLMAGAMLTGCQTAAQKEEAAAEDVEQAREDLQNARTEADNEAVLVANNEEWQAFRNETEARIKVNEARIDELKLKMKKSGKNMDALYADKINALEQKNKDLKTRMNNYEQNKTDWQEFKREFNRDMEELGQSLKDFSVDNKN